MQWLAAALVAITGSGCGRVAFDPRSDAAPPPDALVCPLGYTFDSGSCYRASTSVSTWLGAEAACEADAVGAHLAVIDDAEEAVVAGRYRSAPTDFAWIGTTDAVIEGEYRDVTNRAAAYVIFGAGEPDGDLQDCMLLRDGIELADANCSISDDYICEYDGIPAVSIAWGLCPAGYTFTGGSCYRFVAGALGTANWLEAEALCEADAVGAHLLVVDSMFEAQLIDGFVPTAILDHYVGASDLAIEGVYLSVTNIPLAYSVFAAGEPNGGTAQNCLRMNDEIMFSDVDCAPGDDYVCEYDGITAVPAAFGQ